jgi:hypothetical protein
MSIRTVRSDLNYEGLPTQELYSTITETHLTGATPQYFKTHFDLNIEIATILKAELEVF